MLKTLKPGRYYLIVNIDEPYAEDVYEVIKHGQMTKEQDGERAWPEGDVDFAAFLSQTWLEPYYAERVRLARITGELTPDRDRYCLIAALRAELKQVRGEMKELDNKYATLLTDNVALREALRKANTRRRDGIV